MNPRHIAIDQRNNAADRSRLASLDTPRPVLRTVSDDLPSAPAPDGCARCGTLGIYGCAHQSPYVRPEPDRHEQGTGKIFSGHDRPSVGHDRTQELLRQVLAFCAETATLRSAFGREAVGNSELINGMQYGRQVTPRTVERCRIFMRTRRAERNRTQAPG